MITCDKWQVWARVWTRWERTALVISWKRIYNYHDNHHHCNQLPYHIDFHNATRCVRAALMISWGNLLTIMIFNIVINIIVIIISIILIIMIFIIRQILMISSYQHFSITVLIIIIILITLPIKMGSFHNAGLQILVCRSRLWSAPELQYGWFTNSTLMRIIMIIIMIMMIMIIVIKRFRLIIVHSIVHPVSLSTPITQKYNCHITENTA